MDNKNEYHYCPSRNENVIDGTVDGYTVIATFSFYFLQYENIKVSEIFANYCGQIKTKHLGTYEITKSDILNYKMQNYKFIQNDLDEIIITLKDYLYKLLF
jgi:bifunctional ADP-heptose synthase (sugar kinase/adenylyltransferase)